VRRREGGINVPRADTARSARMHRRRNSRQGDNSRREERCAFTYAGLKSMSEVGSSLPLGIAITCYLQRSG